MIARARRRNRQDGWLGTRVRESRNGNRILSTEVYKVYRQDKRVRESQMTCVCVRVTTSSEIVHRGHRDDRGAREGSKSK